MEKTKSPVIDHSYEEIFLSLRWLCAECFQGELSFFESYDQATGAESLEKRDALTFSGSLSIGASR